MDRRSDTTTRSSRSLNTRRQMQKAADHFEVNIHVFDMSNVKPGFSFHYPQNPVHPRHLYFLQDGHHFHYITNINGVIRLFKRNDDFHFCELCYKIYCSRYVDPEIGHVCGTKDECREPVRPYTLGTRTLAYYPNEGEARYEDIRYIQRPKSKDAVDRKIIYLDFETYLQGRKHVNLEDEQYDAIEPPLHPYLIPTGSTEPYQPCPYLKREFDTAHYSYFQTVNHCECQLDNGETFVFKDLEDTMHWLSQPEQEGALVLAHCGGRFDFQFIFRKYLEEDQLRLKKVKPPLLKGNKIVSATIQNNILLLDSFAFVSTALAKFPAIFNIEEEKKDSFLILSIDQSSGTI